ncbi:hypothetical protein ACJJIF_04055 [Microbulbifer sp. SSSA002]|uniref:hypothetical protein n=1 Tax=unclassified Microbulbifer TaxID=2619833 RepID=UPI0040390EC3
MKLRIAILGVLILNSSAVSSNEPDTAMGAAGLTSQLSSHLNKMVERCIEFIPEGETKILTAQSDWRGRNIDVISVAEGLMAKARMELPEVFAKLDVAEDKSIAAMFLPMTAEIKRQYCGKYFTDITNGSRDIRNISPKAYELLKNYKS